MTLTATAAIGWWLAPDRGGVAVERAPLALFPTRLGGWEGRATRLDADVERVLAADDYLSSVYLATDPVHSGTTVDLFVAYYGKQTGGSGIHSPEVCLPTGGWEVSSWNRLELGAGATSAELNRAVIMKGSSRQLVYYWFEQRGRRLASAYTAKAYTIRDSILRGRTDGALVRLVTPIGPRETESAADARLNAFLDQVLPVLPRFSPP